MRRSSIRGFVLALAVLGAAVLFTPRASADVIYSICTSGCTASSGSYATTASQPGAAGLTFPANPISFTAADLSSGVYTDPTTGTIFTSMNGASVDTLATVNGTSFTQGVHGAGTGIEIALPANTYAFSFTFSDGSFFNGGLVVNGTNVNSTNYLIQQSGSGFVSVISDVPLTSLFIGGTSAGNLSITNFEDGTSSGSGGDGGGATPEPATLILFGSGLVMVGLARRKRLRRVSPRHFS